ncbi:uncharacterized protein LOC115224275 [Argonauta hians]
MQAYWNILIYFLITITACVRGKLDKDVVFEFNSIKFESLSRDYISKDNIISGIQVYNETVYVNIERHTSEVPVTLATVEKKNGKVMLKPFPTLTDQNLNDCKNLQSVGGIRVVRETNLLFVADNTYKNCGAKLVIINLLKRKITYRYLFPHANYTTQFKDIVVDRKGNIYIADSAREGSIIFFNNKKSKSFTFTDRLFTSTKATEFIFGNQTISVNRNIHQLTLSPDDTFLFYVTQGINTMQVPTESFLQTSDLKSLQGNRMIGKQKAKGFGILMGKKYMYFTGLEKKVLYAWNRNADLEKQKVIVSNAKRISMETQKKMEMNADFELYPGKMSFDNYGNLWVVTTDYELYFGNDTQLDADRAYRTKIVKLNVDDSRETIQTTSKAALNRRLLLSMIISILLLCILL